MITEVEFLLLLGVCVILAPAMWIGLKLGLAGSEHPRVFTLVLLVVFAFAVAGLYLDHRETIEVAEPTEATIVSTSQDESCTRDQCDYFVEITYTYEFGNTEYKDSDRKRFDRGYDASEWQKRNQAGNTVQVMVVPDSPSTSWVERENFLVVYRTELIVGAFALFFGGGLILTAFERKLFPHIHQFLRHEARDR